MYMPIKTELFLKRIFAITLTLLIGAPGVIGVFITLFPPNGDQLSLTHTLLGLISSSVFLVSAWITWRWSQTCMLCQTNLFSGKLHR